MLACSSAEENQPGTGSMTGGGGGLGGASGGTTSSGGSSATGGTTTTLGGSSATGGTTTTLGGSSATGGTTTSSGGSSPTGGTTTSSGGAATGGRTTTGGTSTGGTTTGGTTTIDPTATVKVTQVRQEVDGFGFSTAWGSVPSSQNLDAFLSTTKGAGLSIIRNRIPFRERPDMNDNFMGSGNYDFTTVGAGSAAYKNFTLNWNTWDLAATRNLITTIKANPDYRVAAYFSTPWTPPNNSVSRWKLGVTDYAQKPDVGGHLDPAHYADYADVLADYALGFESHMGAPLAALSLQNEPNFKVDYESADWTAAQFHDFMTVLKAEFTKKGVFTRLPNLTIMAPEHNNMDETLIVPTLNDSNVAGLVGIVAGHQYEYGWAADPLTVQAPKLATSRAANKRLWMTEWSVEKFLDRHTTDDIYPCLALAKAIHTDFTAYGLNAYVYWWSSALVNGANPSKVLWTLGQYSRFVRPGFRRVETNATPATEVLLSAYVNPGRTQVVMVAVNLGTAARTFDLSLDAGTFAGSIAVYRTSTSTNLASQAAIAGSGRSRVSVTTPGQSVTTYVAGL